MAPCSGPKETENKKYIQAIIFSAFLFLTALVEYITAMVYQVLQMYSVSLNMSERTVIKWEFHEKRTFSPSCERNPKQVTHEGLHYRISTTDREFVSCVICLRNDATRLWQQCTHKVYSYFEKGCRKKCPRQSRKVLWVVFSSLFFKEISNNGKRGHGRMFASA